MKCINWKYVSAYILEWLNVPKSQTWLIMLSFSCMNKYAYMYYVYAYMYMNMFICKCTCHESYTTILMYGIKTKIISMSTDIWCAATMCSSHVLWRGDIFTTWMTKDGQKSLCGTLFFMWQNATCIWRTTSSWTHLTLAELNHIRAPATVKQVTTWPNFDAQYTWQGKDPNQTWTCVTVGFEPSLAANLPNVVWSGQVLEMLRKECQWLQNGVWPSHTFAAL